MIEATVRFQAREIVIIRHDGRNIEFDGNVHAGNDIMDRMRDLFPNADDEALVRNLPSVYNGNVWAELTPQEEL